MRTGFLGLLATLSAGAGLSFAQAPRPALPPPPPGPPVPPAWVTQAGMQVSEPAAPKPDAKSGDPAKPDAKPGDTAAPGPDCPPDANCGVSVPEGPNAFNPDPHALDKKFWIFPLYEGPGRLWVSGEYLLWTIRREPVPGPLVTTGLGVTPGILGSPGTAVLVGDEPLRFGDLSGGRLTVGWVNDCHTWALEGSGFFLEKGRFNFNAASDANGNPILARPFINSLTGTESAALVSFPGAFSGNIQVNASTQFSGAEINVLTPLNQTLVGGVDFLIGGRYLNLDESLSISQNSTLLPGGVLAFNGDAILAPGTISIADAISARNQFTGGQIGLEADLHSGRLFVVMTAKFGFGNTHEVVNINGATTLSGTGAPPVTVPGGLFAVQGTSGHSVRDTFSFVPEGTINVGVEVTRNLRIFAGYNFLYWTDVVRPGNQVNRVVNPTLVPSSLSFGTSSGGPGPSNAGSHSDFWAQGLNCGVVIRY